MAIENGPKKNGAKWTTVGAGIAGGILLALQGINLSEIGHVSDDGQKRMEVLQQLVTISKDIDASLKNQNQMLAHDDQSFQNQKEILETLKKAIEERREQLKNQ
jgi:hypothetical protein